MQADVKCSSLPCLMHAPHAGLSPLPAAVAPDHWHWQCTMRGSALLVLAVLVVSSLIYALRLSRRTAHMQHTQSRLAAAALHASKLTSTKGRIHDSAIASPGAGAGRQVFPTLCPAYVYPQASQSTDVTACTAVTHACIRFIQPR